MGGLDVVGLLPFGCPSARAFSFGAAQVEWTSLEDVGSGEAVGGLGDGAGEGVSVCGDGAGGGGGLAASLVELNIVDDGATEGSGCEPDVIGSKAKQDEGTLNDPAPAGNILPARVQPPVPAAGAPSAPTGDASLPAAAKTLRAFSDCGDNARP